MLRRAKSIYLCRYVNMYVAKRTLAPDRVEVHNGNTRPLA